MAEGKFLDKFTRYQKKKNLNGKLVAGSRVKWKGCEVCFLDIHSSSDAATSSVWPVVGQLTPRKHKFLHL